MRREISRTWVAGLGVIALVVAAVAAVALQDTAINGVQRADNDQPVSVQERHLHLLYDSDREPYPSPDPEPEPDASHGREATSQPDSEPPNHHAVDRTLSGDVRLSGFEVPERDVWQFDPEVTTTVTVDANVIVRGTLQMQPASREVTHTLRFVGVDETMYQGGHTHEPLESDVGLWVVEAGVLDIEGSPVQGWNRTGRSSTWNSGDRLVVAPNDPPGEDGAVHTGFRPFTLNAEVPSVKAPDGSIHHSEIANLDRNVIIEAGTENPSHQLDDGGRAHVIFLHCQRPQNIRYVAIRGMGPRSPLEPPDTWQATEGRYPLHFHMCQDGSRGSTVEGVVVESSGSHAFVPHGSHGIRFYDTVAYDVWEAAYWWDQSGTSDDLSDASHDILWERAAAFKVQTDVSRNNRAFLLGLGEGNAVVDSVAVGVRSHNVHGGAFHWPGPTSVWEFRGNVAHNNSGAGVSWWTNSRLVHSIGPLVAYHNDVGLRLGAYSNHVQHLGGLLWDNTNADIESLATTRGSGGEWSNQMTFEGIDLERLLLSHHRSGGPVIVRNVRIRDRVIVDESGKPAQYYFISESADTDLSPTQFEVINQLSTIVVENSDGSSFQIPQ